MFSRKLRAVVSVVLGAILAVGTQAVPAYADTNVTLPFAANFQTQTMSAPAGYVGDFGEAYDSTRGYGWTNSAGTPVSLVGNGRERNVTSDKRLDSFIHMQLPAGTPGVATVGSWKAAVPNGKYAVTVAAGDAQYTDSRHVVRVEGVTAVDFVPTAANKNTTQTVTVDVTDGFVNLDSNGGTNTKIDYVEIRAVDASTPYVTDVDPPNGTTGVTVTKSVTVQLSEAVDPTTLDAGLKLYAPGNVEVAGFRNTDGANSNGTFAPSADLAANTQYTIQVNSALKTANGESYAPFSSKFTTGGAGTPITPLFQGKQLASSKSGVTVMTFGPDGALYAGTYTGQIWKFVLGSNGLPVDPAGTEITAFSNTRTITGLRFDPSSTAANPKLWVSHGIKCSANCADFTGKISVLTGSNLSTVRDVVVGLPRAVKDHMNNGIEFGPDGKLYLAQGSASGYGAPDPVWGNRSESQLNATILQMDVNNDAAFNGTVNVTPTAPTNYNPATGPVKIYTEGIRNPFSITWHTNGKLYGVVNESASGNAPAGGGAPALSDLPAYNDYFTQIVPNKYYGHPNPSRGNYILNGGNPTAGVDPFEVTQYPVGTQPNANWRKPDMNLGQHRSANGSAEFKSDVFGGNLKGDILVTEYSQGKDLIAVKLDSSGNAISKTVIAQGFYNPLGVAVQQSSGRVYVAEYGRDPDGVNGMISMLNPDVNTDPPTPAFAKVNFQAQTTTTPSGYSADFGQAFDADRKYGWLDYNGTPLNLVGNGRERNAIADKRLDTFMAPQIPANSSGIKTPGEWELTAPNGTYNVTVSVGDAISADGRHIVRLEGNTVIDFTPTNANKFKSVTVPVAVTDGRLTLDTIGGTNTRVNYIDVYSTDGPAPTPPTVTVTPSGTKNSSGGFVDQATVTVAATDSDGVQSIKYSLDNGAEQTYSAPIVVTGAGAHTVSATATDTKGATSSPVLSNFTIASGNTPDPGYKFNFQAESTATPAGYTGDYGQAFDATRGYGWETLTGTPLSLVGNGRERNTASDKRLDTFLCIQLPSSSPGVKTPGRWELVVPNGTYNLTVAVGDPGYFDSHYVIRAEGNVAIDFTPTSANRQKTVTVPVTITDGRLTLDPQGGTNNKIDYVELSTGAPAAPQITSVTPADGATNVSTAITNVDAIASESIDATTLTAGVKLLAPGNVEVAGSRNTDATKTHVTFVPNAALQPNTQYTFQVNANLKTEDGTQSFTPFTSTFTTAAAADTTPPTVSIGSSGTGPVTVTITATDNAGGSGIAAGGVKYTLDGGAQQTYSGPFTVSASGSHTVVATATDVAGNVSTPASSTFTIGAVTPGQMLVTSPEDYLGLGSRLVFSTVYTEQRPGHSFTIKNNGSSNLNVSSIVMDNTAQKADFQFCAGQTLTNFTLTAGQTKDICVQYRPTAGGVPYGKAYTSQSSLTINSNDSGAPAYKVSLGGLNSMNYGSYHEPNMQEIINGLGYKTTVPVANKPQLLSVSESSGPVGDEVVSAYWKKFDSAKPVGMYPLAHYSGNCSPTSGCTTPTSPSFGWYPKGGGYSGLYNFPGGTACPGTNCYQGFGPNNQKLLPGTSTSTRTFNPAGSFGFRDGAGNYSDDNMNNGKWHNVRFWIVKDANGNVIPNTYIVGDDIGGPVQNAAKNWDYQDYVFLMTNVQPDGNSNQPAPAERTKTLEFNGADGGLANTGFTSTKGAYDASKVSVSNGKLLLQTSANSDTNHTNGLQLSVNAGTDFRVQGRLVGPFDAINAGNEQQAIFFGIDQTHYLKAEIEWASTKRVLTIWKQDGSGSIVKRIDLPNNNASTVDLRIDVTPVQTNPYNGTPIANVYYAIDGSATFTKINDTNIAIPTSWITAVDTEAGVIASHQGTGGAPFTATYENFSVTRRY